MSKHTPGPWITGMDALDIIPRGEYLVAYPNAAKGRTMLEREAEHEANARVIAAAPDLVDVAHMVLDCITFMPTQLTEAATEALRKAGEI